MMIFLVAFKIGIIFFICNSHVDCFTPNLPSTPSSKSELVHVHVLYVPTDRAPIVLYPTNVNTLSAWPNGLGQLTETGEKQAFQLGKFLRRNYQGLIPKHYNASDIYVRSTDYDRGLMTSELVLAGLYYPDNLSDRWYKPINWIPIPVHTVDSKTDYLLLAETSCPKLNTLFQTQLQSPAAKAYQKNIQTTLNRLTQKAGHYVGLLESAGLCDIFQSEKLKGLKWSPWVTKDDVKTVCNVSDYLLKLRTNTPEMRQLSGGVFLNKLEIDIKSIMNKTPTLDKRGKLMTMFSGCYCTVVGMLSLLDSFNNKVIRNGATLMFELHRNLKDNSYFVRSLYKDQIYFSIKKLKIPGCNNSDCPVDTFLKFAAQKGITPDEIIRKCK